MEGKEAEAALIAIANIKNLVLLHQIAKYSANRAQKIEVSTEFLKHSEEMLNKGRYAIKLLKCLLATDQHEFHKKSSSVIPLMRGVSKRFFINHNEFIVIKIFKKPGKVNRIKCSSKFCFWSA